MFIAINITNDEKVSLPTLEQKKILEISTLSLENKLRCIGCGEPLQFIDSVLVTQHFRHYPVEEKKCKFRHYSMGRLFRIQVNSVLNVPARYKTVKSFVSSGNSSELLERIEKAKRRLASRKYLRLMYKPPFQIIRCDYCHNVTKDWTIQDTATCTGICARCFRVGCTG